MSLISDSELAALQGLAESGMTATVAIYNRTTEVTDDGQASVYPSTASSTVLGWLYEMTGNGAQLGILDGAEGISELFRLMVPIGTTLASGDKVVISGRTFIVQHTNLGDTYPTSLKAYLRSVE